MALLESSIEYADKAHVIPVLHPRIHHTAHAPAHAILDARYPPTSSPRQNRRIVVERDMEIHFSRFQDYLGWHFQIAHRIAKSRAQRELRLFPPPAHCSFHKKLQPVRALKARAS